MRMSGLLGAKNFKFFEIYSVCLHGQGIIFRKFMRRLFWTAPNAL